MMTDLDAIRADNERDLIGLAEHPEAYATHDKKFIRDTAIVLAALDMTDNERRSALDREWQLRDALDTAENLLESSAYNATKALLAADEREARLRAALEKFIAFLNTYDEDDHPHASGEAKRRAAALATEAE